MKAMLGPLPMGEETSLRRKEGSLRGAEGAHGGPPGAESGMPSLPHGTGVGYAPTMDNRIDSITDLLLGAAYADDHFLESEKEAIRELLGKLLKGDVPSELTARIEAFDPKRFDVAATAKRFAGDSDDDKYKLLELIAAVHAADDEFDFAEDEYVRDVVKVLGMEGGQLARFTLEFEVEDLADNLDALRKGPPPAPGG